jgi:hypothetical protein
MIDPILNLAVSLQASKGIYAVLIGSGVSRSAGIPTGWEIVLDLIRKLAAAQGVGCRPDPESWYKEFAGRAADYSQILDQLTNNSAERVQLLRGYFEPTEEDRKEGRKRPTRAHRAIAKLVAKGYIRVIVTTNFDRLMEVALSDEGIHASVVSTIDAIQGALPIVHSPCTVTKVHGDYLDSRLRNTVSELEVYEPALNEYLDRLFDEFGTIVCGWSVRWDPALRGVFERCRGRRFGTYWAAYGTLLPEAETLIAFRGAGVIRNVDADSFFSDLEERVQAVETLTTADPISAGVAVARIKRYLQPPEQMINLHDLLVKETEKAYRGVRSERFPTRVASLDTDGMKTRIQAYESELSVFMPMMICAGFWTNAQWEQILVQSLERMASGLIMESGSATLLNMRRYPVLLTLFGLGISAVFQRNYGLLRKMFMVEVVARGGFGRLVQIANSPAVISYAFQLQMEAGGRGLWLSDRIFATLREPFRDYIPDDRRFEEMFDWFEYLIGLTICDLSTSPEDIDRLDQRCLLASDLPYGRFISKCERGGFDVERETCWQEDAPVPEIVADALRAGMFRSGGSVASDSHFRKIKEEYDAYLKMVRRQLGIYDLR